MCLLALLSILVVTGVIIFMNISIWPAMVLTSFIPTMIGLH
jgi:hypothetical protein